LDKLWRAFRQLYPVSITVDEVIDDAGGERAGLTAEFISGAIIADAQAAYERREQEFGSEVMREVERRVVLSVLDRKWREHLYEMDYLREGIGLRGYGQRDPLIEYQREGYDMFSAMMDGIKEESVGNLFNLVVQVQENPIVEEGGAGPALGGPAPGGPAPAAAALGGPAPAPPAPVLPAQAGGPAPAGGPAGRRQVPPQGAAGAPGSAETRTTQGGTRAKRDGRASGAAGGPAAAKREGRPAGAHARPRSEERRVGEEGRYR